MIYQDVTEKCCGKCRALPGTCGLSRECVCHVSRDGERREREKIRRFQSDLLGARRGGFVPDDTQRSILAAHAGADRAAEVARQHQVSVADVKDIWRTSERGD